MNGTSIDKLRYMQQQMPSDMMQQQYAGEMQTGDNFGENLDGNMDQLAREVGESLDNINQQPPPQKIVPKQKPQHEANGVVKKIPVFLREPLIIVVIYVILSLDVVKRTLASYIPQLKPSADGGVMFVGIVIYAMIIAISYAVIKKLLL